MGDDLRLEINAGGLDGFFNGVCSFIAAGNNNAASDSLINSFQNVANKTSGLSGGVGTLNIALGYISTRKTAEVSRKIAVQNVKGKTDRFIQTSVSVDKAVAGIVSRSTEEFYRTNPWLRPPAPPSNWDRFCSGVGGAISSFCSSVGDVINSIGDVVGNIGKFFKSIGEVFIDVLNGIKEFFATHWKEILIVVATIAVVVISVVTGGAAAVAAAVAAGATASAAASGVAFAFLISASVGALCGAGGQLFSDVLSIGAGQKEGLSSWQTYVGAVAGGSISGIMTACGHPILGGAASGAMSKYIGGKIENKAFDDMAFDMAISGVLGAAAGKIADGLFGKSFPSLVGGRNGYNAVFKSGTTKILNGTVKEMSWKVFFKGTAGKFLGDLYKNSLKWGVKSIFNPIPVSIPTFTFKPIPVHSGGSGW